MWLFTECTVCYTFYLGEGFNTQNTALVTLDAQSRLTVIFSERFIDELIKLMTVRLRFASDAVNAC